MHANMTETHSQILEIHAKALEIHASINETHADATNSMHQHWNQRQPLKILQTQMESMQNQIKSIHTSVIFANALDTNASTINPWTMAMTWLEGHGHLCAQYWNPCQNVGTQTKTRNSIQKHCTSCKPWKSQRSNKLHTKSIELTQQQKIHGFLSTFIEIRWRSHGVLRISFGISSGFFRFPISFPWLSMDARWIPYGVLSISVDFLWFSNYFRWFPILSYGFLLSYDLLWFPTVSH